MRGKQRTILWLCVGIAACGEGSLGTVARSGPRSATDACAQGHEAEGVGGASVIANVEPLYPGMFELAARPQLVFGSTAGTDVVGSIADVDLVGTRLLVVADGMSQTVHMVPLDGSEAWTVGRRGEGPGEFESLQHLVVVQGSTILASEWGRVTSIATDGDSTITHAFEGRLVDAGAGITASSFPLVVGALNPDTFMALHGLGRAVTDTPAPGESGVRLSDPDELVWVTAVGNEIAGAGLLPEAPMAEWTRPDGVFFARRQPFAPRGSVAVGPAGAFLSEGHVYEIVHLAPRDSLIKRIRICDRMPIPLTQERVEEFYDSAAASAVDPEDIEILRHISYPHLLPAFGKLLLDPAGRVWAEDLGSGRAGVWIVLDEEGRWLDTAEISRGTLMAVGEEHVVYAVDLGYDVKALWVVPFAIRRSSE